MTTACQATADGLLATAPRSLAVSGAVCNPTVNDVYHELQPVPRNGRAQYATRDGRHFLEKDALCRLYGWIGPSGVRRM